MFRVNAWKFDVRRSPAPEDVAQWLGADADGDTVAAVQDCRFYLSRETVIVIRSKVNAVISNKGEEKVKMALYFY